MDEYLAGIMNRNKENQVNQLPAYLQGRQPSTSSMAATLVGNLGSGSPPSISIRNNKFTAVDSTGAEKPVGGYNQQADQYGVIGVYVDVVLADNNEHTSKVWFEKPFDPNGDWMPPDCWSDNGVGASRNATKPQSALCMQCPKNDWGSAVSKVSGKGIKACHDVQKMAGIIPGDDIIYQLRIPPNSRGNLRDYVLKFTGQPFDLRDVVTRIWFDQQTIGTLKFVGLGWLDDPTVAQRDKALAEKKTDALVGRGDMPVQQLLAAPQPTGAPAQPTVAYAPNSNPAPIGAQPAAYQGGPAVQQHPEQGAVPFFTQPAQNAGASQVSAQPIPVTASPSEPQRRRRRTRAEIDAANGAQAPAAQQTVIPPQQVAAPVTAGPFAATQTPAVHATPNAQPNNFGMQAGVATNPEIEAALADIFGK